jgi:hypothetical protein
MSRIALAFGYIFVPVSLSALVPAGGPPAGGSTSAVTFTVPGVNAPAAQPVAAAPKPVAAARSPARKPAALRVKFSKVALGNVVRVFSARYGAPFTIEAKAKAPITGDYTNVALPDAVTDVARQAGLYAIPMGPKPSDGYRLAVHPAPAPAPATTAPAATVAGKPAGGPADPAEEARAALLRERARLLEQAAKLGS